MALSVDGSPIRGAHVICLALLKEEVESPHSWSIAGWRAPERNYSEGETNPSGSFELEAPKEQPNGSLVIAFHEDYSPAGIELPDGGQATHLRLVLEPATPIQVQVVDLSGKPQVGAAVHHAALPRTPWPSEPTAQPYERFFAQEGMTGADGRIELARFPGEQIILARRGDLVSVPWQGFPSFVVVLTLGASFTLGGTVTVPSVRVGDPAEQDEHRILVLGLKGNLWRQLDCLRHVREGVWGPLQVPLEGLSRYQVRLEGRGIIPIEETFERPRSGAHQRIDFAAQGGGELVLTVEDASKEPIPTAHAEAWWNPSLTPGVCIRGRAGPDGVIRLGALPPGLVRFKVAAPGYVTEDNWEIPVEKLATATVTLGKAGSISGRCLHAGQPVTDFEVIYWRVGNLNLYRSKTFLGRPDGGFQIESLSPGDWSLHAASPIHPSSRPSTVSVQVDEVAEVELELPEAIRGGGTVLDAETGKPVAGAHVQPYSSGGLERSLPWGPGTLTGGDGSFDIDAFTIGLNHLTIEAEGYAVAEAEGNGTNQDFVDWGEIRLVRPQSLQVSLVGLESLHGFGPEDFRAVTEEGFRLPEKPFDRDGVVRYEGVPPGDMRFIVYHPDDSFSRLQLRLDSGKEWNFDLKVAGARKLDVHATDPKGGSLPYTPHLMIAAHEDTGVFVVRMKDADKGMASFEGIRASKVQVFVLDTEFGFVASKDVFFGSDTSKAIEIVVGDQPFRVQVVDAEGAPLPDTNVTIRSPQGAEVHGVGKTDADGWAELVGLPSGQLLMDVQNGTVGRSFGNLIDASVKELEFVLEATGALELELFDGDMPLAGVLTRVQTTAGLTLGDARQTDDRGLVRYESLGQGNYHLACHRADCWPTTVDEELAPGEQARVRVQMRRLANVEFTLLTPGGLPVSDVSVELLSEEFDASVDSWIREERAHAPGGLSTDLKGTIRVEGLPRGTYAWSATAAGQPLSGSFELEAARENRVSAFLPR